MLSDLGLLCWSVFAKDVVCCFCHGSVKAVDQSVHFGFLIFKSEEWSNFFSHRRSKNVCDVGVLAFHPLGQSLKVIITNTRSL